MQSVVTTFMSKEKMNYLFSYTCDDDEPEPPALDSGYLSWRLPAEETHSDWTIEIIESKSKTPRVYHVHKVCISVGPKKSNYFTRLFLNTNFAESKSKTSKIELEDAAAAAFPCMLDYQYSPEHKLEITAENAAALHFLGQYFEIPRLRWEVVQFCMTDLSIDSSGTYYQHAKIFRDETIMKLVVKKCCSELNHIGLESHLMEVSDVALWFNVIKLVLDGGSDGIVHDSLYLSRLIAKFCSSHKELLNAEIFSQLTDATHMAAIDKEAAVPLMQVEGLLVPECKTGEGLTRLQSRCIEPISNSWESIDVPSLQQDLADLNPHVQTCVFKMALAKAKSQLQKAEKMAVKKVLVEGAGMEVVNGIYTRQEKTNCGAPMFSMEGFYQGHSVVFQIFLSPMGDGSGHKCWYITSKLNADRYSVFHPYKAPCNEGNLFTPALTGWRAATTDAGPAPTLKLLSNDEK